MNENQIRTSLTEAPIDVPQLLEFVQSPEAGAVVLFLGTTRNATDGRATTSLDYEAYHEMAAELLQELACQAAQRWQLTRIAVVHRTGHLVPPEASVAIAVSAAHRPAAFDAGRWLIDTLKESVPIWKRENWADGTSDWVLPGITRDCEPQQEHESP